MFSFPFEAWTLKPFDKTHKYELWVSEGKGMDGTAFPEGRVVPTGLFHSPATTLNIPSPGGQSLLSFDYRRRKLDLASLQVAPSHTLWDLGDSNFEH